jgi:hypothetical protein
MSCVSHNSDSTRFAYHLGSAAVTLTACALLALAPHVGLVVNRTIFGACVMGGSLALFAFTLWRVKKENDANERLAADPLYKAVLAVQLIAGLILGAWSMTALPTATFCLATMGVQLLASLLPRKRAAEDLL